MNGSFGLRRQAKRDAAFGRGLTRSANAKAPSPLRSAGALHTGAFTLIELILILALLAIAASIAVPSLSRFFRGRDLNSEARQLLSLTRAGQSRAVSEGFPMLLWVDAHDRTYGLQEEGKMQQGNARDVDSKAEQFEVGDRLTLEAVDATTVTVNGRGLPAIKFLPDGTIDETSPVKFRLTMEGGYVLWLIQSTNRLSYEIRDTDRYR